ncbi:MAG: tRNA (cytidine(34)-2'-O)-methyltransferase [Gammaproteobacteria bacterium]|nr:tRNA (cytidine(34)-2'-O)-methyltransferase [Gammaproteobacteria bacterium]
MFEVVLYEPEIPPNTGNIIRLCAATGARLHLIEPLGFRLDDRALRRAGLDYHEFAVINRHGSFTEFREHHVIGRVFAFTTSGSCSLYSARFEPGDALLFGAETRGLPAEIRNSLPVAHQLRIPMLQERRSLNLANAVAIGLYEALRQCDSLACSTTLGVPAALNSMDTDQLESTLSNPLYHR